MSFAASAATAADHVVLQGTSVWVVEVSASGFEMPTADASAPVADALRAQPLEESVDVIESIGAALWDEDVRAWVVRLRLYDGTVAIEWLGGLEVHLVRAGRALASTRGHRLEIPGAPRVVLRGIGGGYTDRSLDGPARWPVQQGDLLVVTSTALATSLNAASVSRAAQGEDPAAAVLAVADARGFVVAIEVA